MYTINAESIAEGHEKVIRLIMGGVEDVNDLTTEDKELTMEYPEPVNIHIHHPNTPPFASSAFRFGSMALDAYAKQIIAPRPLVDKQGHPDFSYLYSSLIFDYPWGEPFKVFDNNGKFLRVDWPHGNGRGDGTNQIDYVVKKLTENQTSRRAVIVLFEPKGHPQMGDPPCLNEIQFLIRNEKLNMHALFRSNDMLSAWGGNAYALMRLQENVLQQINLKTGENPSTYSMGWLETTSISAHIYFKRDSDELKEFKKMWK